MKKILLSLAAVSMTAGAWAKTYDEVFPAATSAEDLIEAGFIDVTPSLYKFNTVSDFSVDALAPGTKKDNAFNPSADYVSKNFTDEELATGHLIIGGFEQNNNAVEKFKNGMTLYDFGGKIGKALIINGNKSTLADAIAKEFECEAPELGKIDFASDNNNTAIFWILNYKAVENTGAKKIRVRMEVNLYHASMHDAIALCGFYLRDSMGQIQGPATEQTPNNLEDLNYKYFSVRTGDPVADKSDYDDAVSENWNPYRWMVVEFDTELTYDGNPVLPYYIKHQIQMNNGDLHNGAMLIRNFEIYAMPDEEVEAQSDDARELDKYYVSWNDYSPESDPGTVGVSGLESEVNGEVEYFNLNGVKVVNPEKGIYIKKQGNKATKVIL